MRENSHRLAIDLYPKEEQVKDMEKLKKLEKDYIDESDPEKKSVKFIYYHYFYEAFKLKHRALTFELNYVFDPMVCLEDYEQLYLKKERNESDPEIKWINIVRGKMEKMISKTNQKEAINSKLVKIIYKDEYDSVKEVLIPFGSLYNEKFTYRDNVDEMAESIYESGGTWINDTTIIPLHRICSIKCHYVKEEGKKEVNVIKESAVLDKYIEESPNNDARFNVRRNFKRQ